MNPKTVNWKMFLGTEFGLAPEQPFNRAKYAQWRCYWDFGGGMYTDLFVHQLTHMLQATGVRFPRRVVGGGGLYMEYDGRDVPDVATVVADYDEGCQVIVSATMCNDTQLGEVIRGHTGTIAFEGGSSFRVVPQKLDSRPAPPGQNKAEGGELVKTDFSTRGDGDTRALWNHFIECLRSRNPETLCPPETGYAAIATVNLGVNSYRYGKAYYFDKATGKVSDADDKWAKKWEAVSHERGKPQQIQGWKADPLEGSTLQPQGLPEARRRLGQRPGPRPEGLSPGPITTDGRPGDHPARPSPFRRPLRAPSGQDPLADHGVDVEHRPAEPDLAVEVASGRCRCSPSGRPGSRGRRSRRGRAARPRGAARWSRAGSRSRSARRWPGR